MVIDVVKCEVEFDGDKLRVGEWCIEPVDAEWDDVGIRWVARKVFSKEYFKTREQAIKYCMEVNK